MAAYAERVIHFLDGQHRIRWADGGGGVTMLAETLKLSLQHDPAQRAALVPDRARHRHRRRRGHRHGGARPGHHRAGDQRRRQARLQPADGARRARRARARTSPARPPRTSRSSDVAAIEDQVQGVRGRRAGGEQPDDGDLRQRQPRHGRHRHRQPLFRRARLAGGRGPRVHRRRTAVGRGRVHPRQHDARRRCSAAATRSAPRSG